MHKLVNVKINDFLDYGLYGSEKRHQFIVVKNKFWSNFKILNFFIAGRKTRFTQPLAKGCNCLQHRPQLANGRLPVPHLRRLEQVDGEAGKTQSQKLGKSRGRSRERALLHRRRGQRANVVFQSFAGCLETALC